MRKTDNGLDIYRWKSGHRVFFTQIQALIFALQDFSNAPNAEKLNVISTLLLGSAVMMQFAADFPGGSYIPVRDSMAHLDENFSGTFSGDHTVMIQAFRAIKEHGEKFPDAFIDYSEALETVYKAHAYVCKKVAGDGGSLANGEIIAWRYIGTKLLGRALKKSGIEGSGMPGKFEAPA